MSSQATYGVSVDVRSRHSGATTELQVSEPLVMPPHSVVRVYEYTTVFYKASHQSSTHQRVLTLELPPTMNPITSIDAALNITTQFPHGLTFAMQHYPEIGERTGVVGGHFPHDAQAFTSAHYPRASDGPVCTHDTGRVLDAHTFHFDDPHGRGKRRRAIYQTIRVHVVSVLSATDVSRTVCHAECCRSRFTTPRHVWIR